MTEEPVSPAAQQERPTPFLLSHHRPAHYSRCIRVGRLHVCARCLGLYPVLLAVLGAQIAVRAALSWKIDPVVAFLLPVPALVDWARGRSDPGSGGNSSRLVTGMLLGAALGRTLYLHLRQPFHPLALVQFLALAGVVATVEVIVRRRREADDADR